MARGRAIGACVAVAMCMRALAADDPETLLARGACTAAIAASRAAIAGAESASGADSAKTADALAEASRTALECRRPREPDLEAWLAREASLRVRADGADSAAAARVELQQARRLVQLNSLEAADAIVVALERKAAAATWPDAVRARLADLRASLHNLKDEAELAQKAAERAVAYARNARDDALIAGALQDQGFSYTARRRGAEALPFLREADRIVRERFGEKSRLRSDALKMISQAERDVGDFGAAIGSLETALGVARAQAEVDRHQLAVLLLNLGQTLKISGDGERAEPRYREALEADALGPDPAGRTRPPILHGLANLYRERGENARAVALYAEALPLFRAVYGERSLAVAQLQNNYANAQANLGLHDEAIARYDEALAIARERESANPADYLPLANQSMVRLWQKRYADAEPGFRETIERTRAAAAGSESSRLFSEVGLSASLWGQGRLDEAFAAATAAEETRQTALRLAAAGLGERHAIGLQEQQWPSLDFALATAIASGDARRLERAWELSAAARGQVTSVTAQRLAAARGSADPRFGRAGTNGARRARISRASRCAATRPRAQTRASGSTAPSARSRSRTIRSPRRRPRIRSRSATCASSCRTMRRSCCSRRSCRAPRAISRVPKPSGARRTSMRSCCRRAALPCARSSSARRTSSER